MNDLHRINGRWLDTTTSNLCVHAVHRAEACATCDGESQLGSDALVARLNGAEQRAAAAELERDQLRAALAATQNTPQAKVLTGAATADHGADPGGHKSERSDLKGKAKK